VSGVRRRLERLEEGARGAPGGPLEDENERRERLARVRAAAEQENERFFRELAGDRRKAFLEDVGYGGHGAEALRDENFLYPDDQPPFTIGEDGTVVSTRDGKPVTDFHQTLAEVFFWDYVEMGNPGGLYYDEATEGFYMPDSGELAFSRDRCYLPRFFWAIGDAHAAPYGISVPERIDIRARGEG
jgi:hypothetical protein